MKKCILLNKVKMLMFSWVNFSKKQKKLIINIIKQTKEFLKTRFLKNNCIIFFIFTFGFALNSKADNAGEKFAIVVSKKIMTNNGGHHGVLEKQCLDPISKCFNFFDSLKKNCFCPPAKERGNATSSWKSVVICQNQNKLRSEISDPVDIKGDPNKPQFIVMDGAENPNAQIFGNTQALAPHVKPQTPKNQSELNDLVNKD